MKFVAYSLATLAMINAQDADEPDTRKFSHITAMLATQVTTSFSDKELFKMIQNYGCHCFPGLSKIAGGAGPSQDGLDDLCRTLARCHKCIEFDHSTSLSPEWDSDIGKYRWDLNADGSLSCAANTDQHKFDLCTCDSAYASALGAIWDDATFDYTKWNNKHNQLYNFDADNICVRPGTANADDCCGSYPTRYPYDSSNRDCCDASGKTYGPSEDCCIDGSIVSVGSC